MVPAVRQANDLLRRWTKRLFPLFSILILVSSGFSLVLNHTYAHEEEAPWMPVHQVEGKLVLSTDLSLSQWSESHHGHVHSLDGVPTDLMAVHNGTYITFAVQRPFNTTLANAGVAVFLNGTSFNSTSAVWGWVAGHNNSTDPSVNSAGTLAAEQLTIVFGRTLAPVSSPYPRLSVGVAYANGIKVTSWNNGTAANALNYDVVSSTGLELLPHLDIFPRTPFIYAAVLLASAVGFIFLETRRYRG